MPAPSPAPPFAGIHNFRDVGASINAQLGRALLREGVLFRSGRLDDATAADRRTLADGYGVKTVVDLRTQAEHLKVAELAKKNKQNKSAKVEGEDARAPLLGAQEPEWNTVRIDFISRAFQRHLVAQLAWWQILWFFLLLLLRQRFSAVRILGSHVLRPAGLTGLSLNSLRFCGPQLLQTLELLTDAHGHPLLVHCTQGKDRSGLVVMLALFTCGVPVEAVAADYALSDHGLDAVRAEMLREVEELGMDEAYTRADPVVVERVWEFLQEGGGVDAYLDSIEFGEEKRSALRGILCA